VSGCVQCSHDKTKTHNRNDLKLGTVVVCDTVSKPIEFGFKRSKVECTGLTLQNFGNSCHLANKNYYYHLQKFTLIILNCNT